MTEVDIVIYDSHVEIEDSETGDIVLIWRLPWKGSKDSLMEYLKINEMSVNKIWWDVYG